MSEAPKKSFIITLKDSVSEGGVTKFKETVKSLGGEIKHEYSLIKGFSVKLPAIHASGLSKHDDVATVEEDQEVKINS
ncbi:unnamed protein product [Kuraishia capsulata CBS 1993]|uniref:Inhibitor I9 domain-containing protein n=1 Tax=Kuraishia capsulata CBS 1993 TaxID=1382522 RepID=W6MTT6_9ASCO|nr:uncharacterized protein KUCA_T00001202001 [Kuraishia capsulata CBS 1993]CDK25235.1 unnamed protein product [Kuraishia capsulata CBS 1993]